MTTPMRISPWATVARFGSSFRNVAVGSDQLQDDDADEGSEDSTPTAGQADTTEHDRGDAQERVRPGNGCPSRCSP